MKTFVQCSVCGKSKPADELADGVCNECKNEQGTSDLKNRYENLSEPVSSKSDLPVKGLIIRADYPEKIEELVASGKLPKSYKFSVKWALGMINEPNVEPDISLYERYKSAIPDVPDSLRIEMDKLILDKLVSEKKLSAVSRDRLLSELKKIKFYNEKISSNLEYKLDVEKTLQESLQEIDRVHQEEIRRINEQANRELQEWERIRQVNESSFGSIIDNWANNHLHKAQAEVEQRRKDSRCPNCKTNVSTSAYTCPSCGHPLRFGGTRAGAGCLGWTIIFVAIPVLLLVFLLSLG